MAKETKKRAAKKQRFEPIAMRPGGIGLRIEHTEYSYQDGDDDSRYDDDQYTYNRPDTYTEHTIGDAIIDEKYADVVACFPVEAGDVAYLVYATFSTGDSFGHDSNKYCEFVDLYATEKKAHAAANLIEQHNAWVVSQQYNYLSRVAKKKEGRAEFMDTLHVRLTREDGTKYDFHVPWGGHFESLNGVNVQRVCIKR